MSEKPRVVIVQRVEPRRYADTTEITNLAESAGYQVVETITQTREEHPEYQVGSGKIQDVNHAIRRKDADVVIFDNVLDPKQKYNIGLYLPTAKEVLDRYTLILQLFEARAQTRKSQLQVELAQLRYELPRVDVKTHLSKKDEHPGFMGLGEYDENRKKDIRRRIRNIRTKLDKIESRNDQRRASRRDEGFNLVSISGYTNAGKSTLLQGLAEDLYVGKNDQLHADLTPTAPAENSLFTTLDTTTRRMDFEKRKILLTDTVGLIDNIPYWLIDSFRSTFDSMYNADLALIVVDMSEDVGTMREKIVSCHDVLSVSRDTKLLTVLNKVDKVSEKERKRKIRALETLCPNAIAISATSGENVDELKEKIHELLPPLKSERMLLELNDENMSIISYIHDNTYVTNEEYNGNTVTIEFEAPEKTVNKIRAKVRPEQSVQ